MGEARRAAAQLSALPPASRGRAPRRALDPDILALNLEPVSFLIACEQPWSLQKIDAVEFEYRCFLQLARDHPGEGLAPSRDCDLYWHAHILNLELYLEDCRRLFGAPLLHYPFSGRLGPADAARQRARFRRHRRLLAALMSRVPRTHHSEEGPDDETAIPEVPQPRRHAGVAQGA
ncbi:MAG TPA: hypothetical protein VFA75_06465 [Nevskia sp.]|nr:hypothetical protein [Nevskia sp.]